MRNPTQDLQQVQFLDKYARWNPAEGRRETWREMTKRVMAFFRNRFSGVLTDAEWFDLETGLVNMDALPSMRILQMAGPALDRCNVGAYNCSYLPLNSWKSFSELLYILMQGTGVGFSVERVHIDQLPVIAKQLDGHATLLYTIPDTTEGWCDALFLGLETWAQGHDIEFDYSQIRPHGAPLTTKGGRASGPGPLKNLLDFARKLLLNHQGRKLSSLNAHDLACYCGSIVQVGGVRRAALISLSDPDDHAMQKAKSGAFWEIAPERAMANNSVVYTERPELREFLNEWVSLWESGTGERGIFNRGAKLGGRRDPDWQYGTNPCGEIVLRPRQFCNLSIAVARPWDMAQELHHKVKLAAMWGTLQSCLTDFRYLSPEWKRNCEDERLLGVDITGIQDCNLLQYQSDSAQRPVLLEQLRETAINTNRRLAARLGIVASAAVTCIKPSGNSSQLLNVSSGLHPRYAPFYVRRLRIGATSPVATLLRQAGVPHFPENGQDPDAPSVWVFEFPVAAPKNALVRDDFGAIDQLDNWLELKQCYTEHNPSCTIYVKDDEWLEVGAWVYRHFNEIGGLSFLPHDGGIYQLAPYEEITEAEYRKRAAAWPVIDFTKLAELEKADTTEVNREFACTGDRCEL